MKQKIPLDGRIFRSLWLFLLALLFISNIFKTAAIGPEIRIILIVVFGLLGIVMLIGDDDDDGYDNDIKI
jgi:hypothetical protein